MIHQLVRCSLVRPSTSTFLALRSHYDAGIIDQPPNIPYGESDMTNQTRVSFLSQDMMDTDRIGIRGISSVGFRMYDGSFLYGPIAVFPTVALSWRVPNVTDITPKSLRLFFMLQPHLDVLVLGIGDRKDMDIVRKQVAQEVRNHRIGLEIMPTEDAVSTFNFLNSEYRYVAGAFYPPADLEVSRDENARSMNMVEGWDTITDSPFRYNFLGPLNKAHEACIRIYGTGDEGQKAWQLIENIRLVDLKKKEEYVRRFAAERSERRLLEIMSKHKQLQSSPTHQLSDSPTRQSIEDKKNNEN
ncbi:hypothetical protein M3Y96_00743300 [Aphelenchoides besseyi]|nr:hypothetical protein M3Y96_00743300 [Aphelenchoides besseyi]